MKSSFSTTLLLLVAFAGLVPFVLMIVEPGFGDGTWQSTLDAFLLKPNAVVVYVVLFAVGAFISYQERSAFWAICLVPALLAATWPLFRADQYQLPVPKGAVVAFYEQHALAEDGSMGCPPGWQHYTGLAGRMPIGVGQGEQADGTNLTLRKLNHTGGAEAVTLSEAHIPNHNHNNGDFNAILQVNRKTVGVKHDGKGIGTEPDVYSFARMQAYGKGEAHNNMPPFRVMLFCEFTGKSGQQKAE